MNNEPSTIRKMTVYMVKFQGTERWFTRPEEAAAAVVLLAASLNQRELAPAEEFGGSLSWYVDEVPATKFDEVIDEYGHNLHGDGEEGLAGLDRNKPYILIEENVRGGYWLTSFDTPERAADYHDNQEYGEEWTIVELVNVETGESLSPSTETTWS